MIAIITYRLLRDLERDLLDDLDLLRLPRRLSRERVLLRPLFLRLLGDKLLERLRSRLIISTELPVS